MFRFPVKLFVLLLLFAFLLVLSGCTDYQKKYEDLSEEYSALESRYDDLVSLTENDHYQEKYEDLYEEYSALKSRYDDLSSLVSNSDSDFFCLYGYLIDHDYSREEAESAIENLLDAFFPYF